LRQILPRRPDLDPAVGDATKRHRDLADWNAFFAQIVREHHGRIEVIDRLAGRDHDEVRGPRDVARGVRRAVENERIEGHRVKRA
jgi:hypothetical protein